MSTLSKAIRLIYALSGNEVQGLSPSEMAKTTRLSPSAVTQYRQLLQAAGLVEQVPHMPGRFRLGPKLIQIARAYESGVEQAKHRLSETEQRYSRLPK